MQREKQLWARQVGSTAEFINKTRELGHTFKTRQKRTQLWRKRGGTHYISVPLSHAWQMSS